MVRLSDLIPEDAAHLLAKACPRFDTEPFVAGPPLRQRRVAIVTTEGLVCPVSFRAPAAGAASGLLDRLLDEIRKLAPWHAVFVDGNGPSLVGLSGLSVVDAARLLDEIRLTGRASSVDDADLGKALRFASEDVRNWYLQAASARPGGSASPRQLADWFWGETSAGELILALHPRCLASENPQLRVVATSMLVPRTQHFRLKRDI